ncbi:hypothetical protein [Kyrpidia sp.]|uniref:hypothetical protein n=1 Tax=Kyrpidia sp. TaxID=2073077 RepID=UPI0017E62CE7|nr:hypothetical protein [Kyrpidia sp.]MCL6577676.1 hypothetical protein [Kyrpidia sp.]HHY65764.1 hypothetical protein [Alicyclobacillus sp.]
MATQPAPDWAALIADLKETEYQNTLLLTALLEWLIESGVAKREEILRKVRELDARVGHGRPKALQSGDHPTA